MKLVYIIIAVLVVLLGIAIYFSYSFNEDGGYFSLLGLKFNVNKDVVNKVNAPNTNIVVDGNKVFDVNKPVDGNTLDRNIRK